MRGQDGGCLADAGNAGDVESAGPQAVFLSATADLRYRSDGAAPDVERADALGSVDLVAGEGGEVDAEVIDVEGVVAW